MRLTRAARCAAIAAFVSSLCGCAPPANIVSEPVKTPTTGEVFGDSPCSSLRPQTEPDLMAWDAGSRSNLNRLRGAGVVAVRYQAVGCEVKLELLSHCIGTTSKYQFSPYSANQRKVAHNAGELFAQLPVGAAALGAGIKGGRVLRTDYILAGQYALPPDASFRASDLKGVDCARATHVVSAIYVGAFILGVGESRQMDAKSTLFGIGAGASSSADVDVLSTEGDAEACAVAQREGTENYRCAVPLRIGLEALDAPAKISCPEGSTLQGDVCARIVTDASPASVSLPAPASAPPPAPAMPAPEAAPPPSAPVAPVTRVAEAQPAPRPAPPPAKPTPWYIQMLLPSFDRDGDGVVDSNDQCPNEMETRNGFRDSDGCPDQLPPEVAKFVGVIRGIDFDAGRSAPRPEALPTLDAAAKLFSQYPELRLRISVHTDSVGQAAENRALSGRRAHALRDYLIDRGMRAERIEARGAGQEEPIASNADEAGRALNRRVEFSLIQ
ncbi:MAG TPA: OmpA family protein [Polyangiaceae bacterium]|nr:OmpA family protein [Polyangiaceae bacterium]